MRKTLFFSPARLRRLHFTTAVNTAATTNAGLFNLPSLTSPDSFISSAHAAISTSNTLRASLPSLSNPVDTLYALDKISNVVCSVIDAAELTRNVHHDAAYRDAATQSFTLLADYIAELNGDRSLYDAAIKTLESPSPLSEEQQRMSTAMKREFEREGIHLPANTRTKIRDKLAELTTTETAFSTNIHNARSLYPLPPSSSHDSLFPSSILTQLPPSNVTTDPYFTHTILRHDPDPATRKEAYIQSYSSIPENLPILADMQRLRHSISNDLGFSSFAEKQSNGSMLAVSQIPKFLASLQQTIRPKWKSEMELLMEVRRQNGDSSSNEQIAPWDLMYYKRLAIEQRHSTLSTNYQKNYTSCFTLSNCIRGLNMLTTKLFKISLTEVTVRPSETWAPPSSVRKFSLHHPIDGDLGTIYFDLAPRQAKFGGAAHFTVRCGCKERDGTKQLPIVALVCNFSNPGGLHPKEVKTLFHEFGHALHSLLSLTSFQHLSGTRGATDFVEMPSHLLEHFAADINFAKEWAVDCDGNSVRADSMEGVKIEGGMFEGVDIMQQLLLTRFDQEIFGEKGDILDSGVVWGELHKEMGMECVGGTFWYANESNARAT